MERSASVRLEEFFSQKNKSRSFYRPPRHTETDSIRAKTPIITLCNREHLYRCAKYRQPPFPPPPTQKILTHVYINAEIHFIHLQMHNEAQKQAYYPFSKIFKIQTIMDKSPWDSQNVTSILCVSQVLSQKAVLSFYKSMSPPNTVLKYQRNCALTVLTLSVGWGRG